MPQVLPADTSMYSTLGRGGAQTNLLGPMASFASIQNQLNQNALFQQTFRARQAMGPLAQQAINPQTGQMDWNKFSVLISTHPETAFMAPEVLNQIAQKKLVDAQTLSTNLQIAQHKQQAIGGAAFAAASAMTGDPNAPADTKHVIGQVADLLPKLGPNGEKLFDPSETIAYVSQLTNGARTNGDLKGRLLTLAQGSLRGSEMLSNIDYRPDAFHDVNGNPYPGFVNKLRGGATPSAGAGASAPSDNTAASMTGIANGGNVPQPASLTGNPPSPVNAGGAPGGGTPSVPTPAPVPGSAAPPDGAPQRTLTQLAPGPLRTKQLGDVADYEKDLNSRATNANNLVALMGQARQYLRNFTPGGGTEFREELGRLAQSVGAPPEVYDRIANGDLSNVQAARKMLFGVGSTIAAQLIHQSGGRLTQNEWAQTLLKGSPNIDLTEGALSKIMGSMRDLANYTKQEQNFYNMKKSMPNYDLTHAQNDWQKVYGAYLDDRYGAQ